MPSHLPASGSSRSGWRPSRAGRSSATRWHCAPPSAATTPVRRCKSAYDQATAWHTTALAEARETAKELKKEGDAYAAAALEFAVGYHKAALTWLRTAPTR